MVTVEHRKKLVVSIACAVMAASSFVVFVICALTDKSAAAATAAALCLALAVLAAFDLESFEGLGIKAKLRSTLGEAERKIQQIDRLTTSLARFAFLTAARGRMTNIERQELVRELTASLTETGATAETIQDLKVPFMASIASQF